MSTNVLPQPVAAERRAVLAGTAEHWVIFDLDTETVARARQPFPAEPIRTLDAIHLATATLARALVPDLALLSLDGRVRHSAEHMGFPLLPRDEA